MWPLAPKKSGTQICGPCFWIVLLVTAVLLCQANASEDQSVASDAEDVDKRNIRVLARTGKLPYTREDMPKDKKEKDDRRNERSVDKRYVAALARNGELPFIRQEYKKFHPMMSGNKHSGEYHQVNDKRHLQQLGLELELLEEMIDDELHKNGFPALVMNGDVLRENQPEDTGVEDEVVEEEKRMLSSLARGGGLRTTSKRESLGFSDVFLNGEPDKRNIGSLARMGYLPHSKTEEEKRSLSSLLKTGRPHKKSEDYLDDDLSVSKRNLRSLLRNGNLPEQLKRREELEDIVRELEDEEEAEEDVEKRSLSSLVRNRPWKKHSIDNILEDLYDDKRSLSSLVRNSNLRPGKRSFSSLLKGRERPFTKKEYDDEEEGFDDFADKRSLSSFMRGRVASGKRGIGSLARNGNLPFSKREDYPYGYLDEKRNIGALARNWDIPGVPKILGKRSSDVHEASKRYFASLLRKGRYPVTTDHHDDSENDTVETELDKLEAKRHIGSLAAQSTRPLRKKAPYSSGSTDNLSPHPTTSPRSKRSTDENSATRSKRHVGSILRSSSALPYQMSLRSSEEYPLPVMQNSDWFEYDDGDDFTEVAEKRFLGSLARGGWFPRRFRGYAFSSQGVDKRHIGSLAREDSISGPEEASDIPKYQASPYEEELTADSGDFDYSDGELDQGTEKWKRYLVLPALDNILLRRLYPAHVTST